MAIIDEQRSICEDLERLEQACADRMLEDPKTIRENLARDHQIAKFVDRFQQQSQRLLDIVADPQGMRRRETDALATHDPFEEFYRQLNTTKEFHRRYPNEPVENLERAYRTRSDAAHAELLNEIDAMFTGEESLGRYFDLNQAHEEYLNLPGVKRMSYLQYLAVFDQFDKFSRAQKVNERYFKYLTGLADYLEGFLKRTKPLENPDQIIARISDEFAKEWEADEVPNWGSKAPALESGTPALSNGNDGFYCAACAKSYANKNVYEHHLPSKRHKKAVAALGGDANGDTLDAAAGTVDAKRKKDLARLKDRAIAEREWRVIKLVEHMHVAREATATNVERKASLTERERQMELDALYAESTTQPAAPGDGASDSDDDDDDKIYNPLKLPLAWDGKPIPYWLYKLHGLGVEFPCEICGNFVYMGRRAFDKHFNEYRHIHGLRCLGITNTTLFREITKIDEAQRLWDKLERDRKSRKTVSETVEEMEDAAGNVMPRKVFEDLQKQGLL